MINNGNESAFPAELVNEGLTKRELFAAMAMEGLLASEADGLEWVPEASVKFADALLAELEKGKDQPDDKRPS